MLNGIDGLILCGGMGTRIRSIAGDAPKSMMDVGGRPFLEVLLRQLQRAGVRRVAMAVGYRAEAIEAHFGPSFLGLELVYSVEQSPLGTGGAIRNALPLLRAPLTLAMNGDSYTDIDLRDFLADYRERQPEIGMVAVPVDGRTDAGSLKLNAAGDVEQFEEKQTSDATKYLNAGIYALTPERIADMPAGAAVSLEREMFPRWVAEGRRVRAYRHPGKCVDIGTPERYLIAQDALAGVETEAAR